MSKIESKVLVPAVAGFIAAVLALAAAFGLDLTADQQNAILGVAVAAVVALQAILGYAAPHTPRPDLEDAYGPHRGQEGYTLVEVALGILILVIALAVLVRFL